ncbi:MAG: Holliday junction branch migration protein RuvA [Pseudoflavonifractor sp.]|nr:Holliday junction branch migration protein RuvA [Alloprevotella sp.]MCM1116484.1 Holliday junction branch migration protein RuvA [Pseudoflavonifractor sp.]
MIEYIIGRLSELTPTYAVIEAGGIGYHADISLTTYVPLEEALAKDGSSAPIKLLIHEIIREDAHLLFGFLAERERALFRALLSVSGVGANTARMILSSVSPAELEQVIASGDSKRLKAVKGIGAKTAERIIIDLRDKIKIAAIEGAADIPAAAPTSEAYEEALAALLMLGFAKPASQKVLKKIFDSNPSVTVEAAIKRSLTMM